MELYKGKKDGGFFTKTSDPKNISGEKASRYVSKGELFLVKKVEEDTQSEKYHFPYKKYTLLNNNWLISVNIPNIKEYETYEKASLADVPEYLFLQIKKPKVYITIGVLLLGLAVYSIIKERQNN